MAITAQEAQRARHDAECLYTSGEVQSAYDRMAQEISVKLGNEEPLVLCVMNGGLIAAGHLLTRLDFPLQMDYIHATRYGGRTEGGDLEWIARPKSALKDRTILIIDDIHDVGATLKAIIDHCRKQGAKAVYSAVLVNKLHDRKVNLVADFVGLDVGDRYVFGCGMDYKGYWRNLPAIYAVKE